VLGVVFGFSHYGFTPQGASFPYDGRLLAIPRISKSRDPLFYGKIQFGGGSVTLNNADGYFDDFIDTNDIYGFECKLLAGYENLDISEYREVFTGYIENSRLSEESAEITITDRRKQLTKPITYTCTNSNALDAIKDILTTSYSEIVYTETFFDTTAWEVAQAAALNVTINMQQPDSVINVIQDICASTFGLFLILADGRFSFKIIDTGDDPTLVIEKNDIFNRLDFNYDSSQVISSIRVGHSRDWVTTSNQYTYLTDTSRQASVFSQYKTYNQKDFNTLLPSSALAAAFATTLLEYNTQINPTVSIKTPLSYIDTELGDVIYAELDRQTIGMFGIRKCEVLGVAYDFDNLTMDMNLRRLDETLCYLGEDADTLITLDDLYWGFAQ
jgi:hypothetical protein